MTSLLPRIEAAADSQGTITFLASAGSGGPEGEQISWGRLHDDATAMAAVLQSHGVAPGTHVAILGPTTRPLVTAIEARDPTTHGHSGRVATLTVGLAEALARHGEGEYRAMRFTREDLRELRYACLLHDFGKVAVREEIVFSRWIERCALSIRPIPPEDDGQTLLLATLAAAAGNVVSIDTSRRRSRSIP